MKSLKILLALIVLVSLGAGMKLWLRGGDNPGQAQAAADEHGGAPGGPPQPMPVPAIVMEEAPIQIWKEFPGRLEAVDIVELRPQVSGTIKEIKFGDGENVKAGHILFVIDTRPYEAEVSQARADLQGAKNQYELAQKELKRAEELIATGAIPKRTYDERLNTELVTKSAIASSEARLKRAQLNLDYAYVKAPISGRVSRAEITEGNLVEAGPNAPVLTTIVSSDGIYAGFEVDEQTYLRYVRSATTKDGKDEKNIPVKLVLQNDQSTSFDGNIYSFDNRIDPRSGTIRARAYFKNADAMLLPGMFVRVLLGSAQTQIALIVPERAIGTDQDRKFVYVVSPEKKVQYREVVLGESVNGSRIITKGLAPDDIVITDGIMKVQPEMPVDPQITKHEPHAAATLEATPPVTDEDAIQLIPEEPATEEHTAP